MKKLSYYTLVIVLFANTLKSQDVHFSQSAVGNVNLNPALAGNDSIGRVGIVYRNQWPNLSGNYVTTSVNGYQYISKLNAYAGINYINDNQANTFYTNIYSLFYVQNINIKNLLIRPAFELGYGTIRINTSNLTFGDMMDPRRGLYYNSSIDYSTIRLKTYLDYSTGIAAYYKSFLIGFSIHHLTQPDVGFFTSSKLHSRYSFQASYDRKIMRFIISPYIVYQKQQNFSMLTGGVNTLLFKHINIGFAYRNSDAFIAAVGYQNRFIRITYSYDNTVSELGNNNTGGAHEISTILNFWKTTPKKRLIKVNSVFS